MDLNQLQGLYDFTGKTVVVSGGTGVLGSEMAAALVGCHADVVLLSRNPAQAAPLLDRLAAIDSNGSAKVLEADVLDAGALREAEARVRRDFGPVYALVNGAGGNRAEATTNAERSFFDLPEEALRFVFDLNLVGTILPTQVFGRGMAEAGEGVILNVSSMSAFQPLTRVPVYSAAKAGVNAFTQWLAVHLAQEYSPRLRVNALAPGFFLTHQNRFLLTDEATGDLTERGRSIIAHTPMNRFGDPEDLLGTVLWLLSPASAFVTGIVVPVDGGFSAFGGV